MKESGKEEITVLTARATGKPIYRQYADILVEKGDAYYAFDTPEQLETLRE